MTTTSAPAKRKLTLGQAKSKYPHRFTMDHVPAWYRHRPSPSMDGGTETRFYAPQYRTDQEWYENTAFPGEPNAIDPMSCYSRNQTWPLGEWLDSPYKE